MKKIEKFLKSISDFGLINMIVYVLFFRRSEKWQNERNGYFFLNKNGNKILNPKINSYKTLCNDKIISLRRFTSDLEVFNQIFFLDEYSAIVNEIKENNIVVNTIIDAGANIGLATIYLQRYFPFAKFYCIEPNKRNVLQLKKNLKLNSIEAKIFQRGLWNKNVRLYLDRSFRDGKEWSYAVTEKFDETEHFDAIELNGFVKENSIKTIDLLKIDIEGSEFKIFSKDSDLAFLSITKSIAIEIHSESGEIIEIINLLKDNGFELRVSGEYYIGINKNFNTI